MAFLCVEVPGCFHNMVVSTNLTGPYGVRTPILAAGTELLDHDLLINVLIISEQYLHDDNYSCFINLWFFQLPIGHRVVILTCVEKILKESLGQVEASLAETIIKQASHELTNSKVL